MPIMLRPIVATLLAAAAATPALAQDPIGTPELRQVEVPPPAIGAPATPAPAAPMQMSVNWPVEDAQALLAYVGRVGEEGLDPRVPAAALADAIRSESPRSDDAPPPRPSSGFRPISASAMSAAMPASTGMSRTPI